MLYFSNIDLLELSNTTMSYKTFRWIKILLTAILAMTIITTMSTGDWYIPGATVIAVALLLWTLKSRVTDITEDERDWMIAGKAALIAMSLYSITIAALGTTFVALGKDNELFYIIGTTLLYSTSALVIMYAIFFKIYAWKRQS
jgi:uncharacterized membrane protein